MDHDFFNQHQEEDQRLSRRGLFKKAGLMGLGALGICSAFERMVPGARAEGTQNFLHAVQRSGNEPTLGSPPRSRKAVPDLLKILQSQAGGPQAIEAARQGGAQFSLNNGSVSPFSVVFSLGQMQVRKSWIELNEAGILRDSTIKLKKHTYLGNPHSVAFNIDFPKNGWYLLNIEGITRPGWSVKAKMGKGLTPNQGFQTWHYPPSRQIVQRSFPAVYQHTGGPDILAFWVTEGAFLFLEASVEAL